MKPQRHVFFIMMLMLIAIDAGAQSAPDKSGVKPSVISLPSGAGSIEGLGDSFEPQLNTGSSTYGVGIVIPPGVAGLEPTIRLSYNSGLGNSFVGLGWSLELPTVRRQTDKGFPSFTSGDTFLFGGEELVPLSNPEADWRCENEREFQRFRQVDTDSDYQEDAWEMTTPDGTRHYFGQYRGASGRHSVVVHPSPPSGAFTDFDKTFVWALDTTIDPHGNRIEYEYYGPAEFPGSANVLYPKSIRYSLIGANYHEIRFRYEDRPDVFTDYRGTFAVTTGKRLSGIDVYSHYDGLDFPVRFYDLEYEYRVEDDITVPVNAIDTGVSLLKRVVQRDRTESPGNFLPPLLFFYSSLVLDDSSVQQVTPPPTIEIADQSGNVQIVDIDGDGLPDIFKTTTYNQEAVLNRGVVRNDVSGELELTFSSPMVLNPASAIQLSLTTANLTDFDGDGLSDYVMISNGGPTGKRIDIYGNLSVLDRVDDVPPGISSFYSKRLDGAPPAIAFDDTSVRQMDLNFDKISDFIKNESGTPIGRFYYYYTDADGSWHTLGPVSFNADMTGYNLLFEDSGAANPRVHLADMNGDRLLDLVYLQVNGSGVGATLTVRYWPYKGLGLWDDTCVMLNASGDSFQIDTLDLRDVLVQDMTGDGLADIAIMKGGGSNSILEFRVNVAGKSWSPPYTRTGLPRYSPRDPVNPTTFRLADLNGNGSTDMILRNLGTTPSWYWFELLPDGKPNLLTGIDNSLGKVTQIVYGNAVDDMIRARNNGFPWTTKCPMPIQVVRRISTTCGYDLDGIEDDIGGTTDRYVTEIFYRDAYYDAFEREFRGFAFAQRIDYGDDFIYDDTTDTMVPSSGWNNTVTPTGQVSGPTLVTRYRYLTGAADGLDNDAGTYPDGWMEPEFIDDLTPLGGREEEILKGLQVWEEKVDPWVLHEQGTEAGFDQGCSLAVTSDDPIIGSRMTSDDYVYTRTRQEWRVRRLYRPTEHIPLWVDMDGDGILEPWNPDIYGNPQPVPQSPPGRFALKIPPISVLDGSGRTVSYAFISESETEVIEANGILSSALGYPLRSKITTMKTSDYDDYGNQILDFDHGVVGDASYDDERKTLTEYALANEALERWMIRNPARIIVSDENNLFASETRHYYDGPSFIGLGIGNIGARALLHRIEKVVTSTGALPPLTEQSNLPGDPRLPANSVIDETRNDYDSYGNIITILGPRGNAADINEGHATQVTWDSRFVTFPVQETIIPGQGKENLVIQADYDPGLGVLTQAIDFNDNITSYEYDSFGRLVAVIKPGDTSVYPTQLFEYVPADPIRDRVYVYDRQGNLSIQSGSGYRVANRVITRSREQAGSTAAHVMVNYTDGNKRKLASVKEGETNGKWIVSEAKSYNRRRTEQAMWLPYDLIFGSSDASIPHFGKLWPTGKPPEFDLEGRATVKTDKRYNPTGREIITINPFEKTADIGNESARTRVLMKILPLEHHLIDENDCNTASQFYNTPMIHQYDGLNRLITVIERVRLDNDGNPGPLTDWNTQYQYDLNDNLVHIMDSQNNEKWMRFDGIGRKIFMNDPDRGVMFYTYDAASNLSITEDAKAQVINYTYDGANRLLTEDYLDEGLPFSANRLYNPAEPISENNMPDVAYFYDVAVENLDLGDNTNATATNTKGFLSYVIDLAGEEHYSFDNRGRIEMTVKRIPDLRTSSTVSYCTRYAFDALDRVTQLTYPDNDKVYYEYNARNQLQRIYGGQAGDIIASIIYTPSDQHETIAYGNGTTSRYFYDPRLRMITLISGPNSDPTNPFILLSYNFDSVSNINSIIDNRPITVVPDGDNRRNTQLFTYDDLNRITHVHYSFTPPEQPTRNDGEINYRFDRIGNMITQSSDIFNEEKGQSVTDLGSMTYGGPSGAWNRIGRSATDPPGPHALTGADNGSTIRNYPYDENGNMTSIDGLSCIWDFKDRLVQVADANMTAHYTYDYTDRRTTKHVIPKTPEIEDLTTTYIDKYFEVREHDQPTKYLFNADTRVAQVIGSLTNVPNRIQRFSLFKGWNLRSLAVQASNSATQLGLGTDPDIEAIFVWNSATKDYTVLNPGDSMPANSVFWLKTTSDKNVSVSGFYNDPTTYTVQAGGDYVPASGLESSPYSETLPDKKIHKWKSELHTWLNFYQGELESLSNLRDAFQQGEAVFVNSNTIFNRLSPESVNRIKYYHQDHLGSSTIITGTTSVIKEEYTYFPFGYQRNSYKLDAKTASYYFVQKEADAESLLQYFNSRYFSGILGRFISLDQLYSSIGAQNEEILERVVRFPQRLNLFAYVQNNPMMRIDPSGLTDIHIFVYRNHESQKRTLGTMRVVNDSNNRTLTLKTLELPDRNNQKDISRIKAGTYAATRSTSKKHGNVIRLEDKNNRKDVLIHIGNEEGDTKGCILTGKSQNKTAIWDSEKAQKELIKYVDTIESSDKKKGEETKITVTVLDPPNSKKDK